MSASGIDTEMRAGVEKMSRYVILLELVDKLTSVRYLWGRAESAA